MPTTFRFGPHIPGMKQSIQPFSRQEALARGITVHQLASTYTRVFQNSYVVTGVPVDPQLRARAALRLAPAGAFASHHTAGQLHGVWTPSTAQTHISIVGGNKTRVRGIKAHLPNTDLPTVMVNGLRCSSAIAVFCELAASQVPLVDLVAVGDSIVRRNLATPEQLIEQARRWRGRGARLARRAASLVRPGVDSSTETRTRLLFVMAGLPEPVVNYTVRDEYGEPTYRIDLAYLAFWIAAEYDGRHHAENSRQWRRDIRRREQLEADGWRFIIITADDLFNRPSEVLERVTDALVARGFRATKRPSAEWYREFPDRG